MKKRVIALIDFSSYSENLMRLADSLAETMEAGILLIHQVPGIVPALADNNSRREIIEVEKSDALEQLKSVSKTIIPAKHSVNFLVTERPLGVLLPEIGSGDSDDLILVGLKGTGILKKIFMGSTASKIIDDIDITTIAVPVKMEGFKIKKLVIAVNPKFPLNIPALTHLLHTFKSSIKQVEFISIITPDDNEITSLTYLKELTEHYRDDAPCSFRMFAGEDVFKEIKTFMDKEEKPFLVVQKGSRTINDQVFRKFLINDLVYHGNIPMIILP
ncbi:universal stress protein [Antarcticibacterium arcticum]|uniref:Universal stress protein n=1 Tax=Antarcticibacterium arcticum TaxID=2585771 RepID=A0A5B8YHF1_9FLAO|nr:universal stress protein [Antarcticibacterium arcticum]QED37350.1 universal stress protein [Antarcticibacterium arcticum]